MTQTIDSQTARFMSKISPEALSGCWLWTAAVNKSGYGMFNERWDNKSKRSIVCLAHRFSFKLANRNFDDRFNVLHHCDNPACVNPSHLFAGTQADNVADMDIKGRRINSQLQGERHPNSKVNKDDVYQMLEMRKNGFTQQSIANKFGISQVQVGNILRKDQWKHIQ